MHRRNNKSAVGVAVGSAFVIGAAGLTLAPNSSAIVGGSATNNASVVQLVSGDALCTGTVVSSRWVLTARHCVDGISSMNVYLKNDTVNPGLPVRADRWAMSPRGDVALVHTAKALPSPAMKMTNSYVPRYGDAGVIYGYGDHLNTWSKWLYRADVKTIGRSYDAYGGRAVHIKGVNGADNHGDSGGPLVVHGVIVGVDSTGDTEPVVSPQATSNYANLTISRNWIKRTAGI